MILLLKLIRVSKKKNDFIKLKAIFQLHLPNFIALEYL